MPESKHIAVFAFPFATHAVPLLSLTRSLSDSVSDLRFFFFSTQQSNAKLFGDDEAGFERIKPVMVDTGLPEGYVLGDNPHEPVEYFVKAMPENYKKAVAEMNLEFDCLLTDAFLWFSKDMAEEMNVPWIPYFTSGPRPLLIQMEADVIRSRFGSNAESEDKTLDFLPGFSKIRAKDLMEGVISGSTESPFLEMLQKMGKTLPKASAVAINSYEEIDPIVVETLKSKLPNFLNIGPFILKSPPSTEDTHGCLDWLNNHMKASVAYICFGSFITPPPPEIQALAEALEETQTPFIWSLRGNPEELLPKGFTDRTKDKGLIVPWAPQLKILGHSSVGAFVTHCGWNSVCESVIGGVPLICRSFFAEQALNQRTVEAVWGFGVGIEGGRFSKEGTVKALNVVLSSQEGELMREKIGVYKKLAFKAVDSEGSSTRNFNLLVDFVTSGSDC